MSFVPAPLRERYAEPQRHYHTLAHIEHMLRLFVEHQAALREPEAVRAAILYHDAVYDPTRSDNERRSVALFLHEYATAEPSFTEAVATLIASTITHHPGLAPDDPLYGDCCLFLDFDLAILGAPPAEYDVYERAIRAEYTHVADDAFRTGRLAVLRELAAGEAIFFTAAFRERYEGRARENLGRAMRALGG